MCVSGDNAPWRPCTRTHIPRIHRQRARTHRLHTYTQASQQASKHTHTQITETTLFTNNERYLKCALMTAASRVEPVKTLVFTESLKKDYEWGRQVMYQNVDFFYLGAFPMHQVHLPKKDLQGREWVSLSLSIPLVGIRDDRGLRPSPEWSHCREMGAHTLAHSFFLSIPLTHGDAETC